MSRGLVYTLHLWPAIAHAKHYTGSTRSEKSLPGRLADHALGRGARLTQVQVERGGSWVLAQTEPGGNARERQLKQRGAARRCEVCRAVKGYQAGELSREQALARAGWDRASQHERGLLLEMFGFSRPPEKTSAPQPGRQAPRSAWCPRLVRLPKRSSSRPKSWRLSTSSSRTGPQRPEPGPPPRPRMWRLNSTWSRRHDTP